MSSLRAWAVLATLATACGPRAAPAPITGSAPADPAPTAPAWMDQPEKLSRDLRAWYAGAGDSQCRVASDTTARVFVVVDAVTDDVVDRLAVAGVIHDPDQAGHNWELTGTLDRAALDEVMALPFVVTIGEIGCASPQAASSPS
jgi:hypothetical protein